jgi:hypothetical protein
MPFQLHPNARDWFKKVQGKEPLEKLFDSFALCLSLGIGTGRFEPLVPAEGDEFVGEFIQRYKPYELLMVGAMLSKSLQRQGVAVSDREAVIKELERLVDSSGNGFELTPAGFREINGYAAGGFNFLREELEEAPNDIGYLMDRFYELLQASRNVGSTVEPPTDSPIEMG